MRSNGSVLPVLVCACLAAGLLWDPMGFLRMALLCSAVHEAGHVLVWRCCSGCWPQIKPGLGGFSLSGAPLSSGQELAVLCAGPLANFVLAGVLYAMALHRARYGVYFLAAVSLCTGLYNLLPFGVLDGARILENVLPTRFSGALYRVQRALMWMFCLAAPALAFALPLPNTARTAALIAPAYLLMQSGKNKQGRSL